MEQIIVKPNQNFDYVNKVTFIGSIVHKFRSSKDSIVLTIAVKGREDHDAEHPNVVFYGEEIVDLIDKSFEVEEKSYPRVEITASVQTSRKKYEDGSVRYFQNIVGESIQMAPTNMEKLFNKRGIGNHKAESKNEVCLAGSVVGVYPIYRESDRNVANARPVGATVTLRTMDSGHINYPRLTCFRGTTNAALALEVNDMVYVSGYVTTNRRDTDEGKKMRYESIFATEIAKA